MMSTVALYLERGNDTSSSKLTELDLEKLKEFRQFCEKIGTVLTESLILINIHTQRLHLLERQTQYGSYSISTAAKGAGQEEGSEKTPLGVHCVQGKIGDGADPFAIFRSRERTGEIAIPKVGGSAIVGRILWLSGLQPGINQGQNSERKTVDTYSRYIYIHGTNDIENIGSAVSAGCIRMIPSDVIEVFDKVREGTLVHIYQA